MLRFSLLASGPFYNSEASTSLVDVSATNLLKSLGVPLRGRILQTWVRGHCVFNLADPWLMSESAVCIDAPLRGVLQKDRGEEDGKKSFQYNSVAYGRMIRQP